MNANSCIIRGGSVVCADRVLPDHDVVIVDGRIAAIEPLARTTSTCSPAPRSARCPWWTRAALT